MDTLWYYMVVFAVYSVVGWAGDTLYTRLYYGEWVKRGFHHGPFYMLYGWGGLATVLLFTEHSSIWQVVPIAAIYSSVIEYSGSWIMEQVGLSYWDYSKNRLNLHGRICLQSISIFVLGTLGVLYLLHPLLRQWLGTLSPQAINLLGVVGFLYLFAWGAVRMALQHQYYRGHHHLRTQAYDIAEAS